GTCPSAPPPVATPLASTIVINSYLSDRKQYVFINEAKSNFCKVTSGVPQGSVLGPCLFLIYVNDLIADLECNARLFADDCVLYRRIKNSGDCFALQRDLEKISHWCSMNRMDLNVSKTKVLCISKLQN